MWIHMEWNVQRGTIQVFINFSSIKHTYEVEGCINTAVKLQISEDPHHIFHILQKSRTIA